MNHEPAVALDMRQPRPAGRNRRRWLPPNGILIVSIIALATGIGLQVTGDRWDLAVANILTLALSLIALVTLLVWFTVGSGFQRRVRLIPLACVLLAGATGFACLQVDGFSGELVPRFRFRWSPARDTLLEELPGEQAAIELVDDADSFHQFLGPDRNSTVRGINLARDWEAERPELLWRREIGAGWSAFSATSGYAVTMEQRGNEELVSCYEVSTGELKWWNGVPARHETHLGGVGPRSTPTIDERKVYALGATGILRCLDMTDGREIWRKDLLKEFNIPVQQANEEILWGRSASPLVVDNVVIVPPGGRPGGPYVSLVAYDKQTGQEVWRAGSDQISYSSPALATIAGVRQVLIVNESSVSGHRLEGEADDGRLLWKFQWPGQNNTKPSTSQAVAIAGDRILVSKHYGEGSGLFQIHRGPQGVFSASQIWHKPSVLKTKFSNVAIHQGHAYALSGEILECVELETGDRQWKKGRYGHGQILLVEDVLLVLSESGEVALVDADPGELKEFARLQAIEGQTWNTICLYGRHLLVRNGEQAACYLLPVGDTSEPPPTAPKKKLNRFVLGAGVALALLLAGVVVNLRQAGVSRRYSPAA